MINIKDSEIKLLIVIKVCNHNYYDQIEVLNIEYVMHKYNDFKMKEEVN